MNKNEQIIGRFPFVVEPFSEDFMGRLSWGYLGNHLLRCASLHAGMHGFGYDDVNSAHHAWVLSRLVVEMNEFPCSGAAYTVETWVSNVYRQFTDRLFSITGEHGEQYGYAYSIWALIDVDTRQPMDFSGLQGDTMANVVCDRQIPISGPGRVRVKSAVPVKQVTAYYSDLDINGHVNSIRYIQMILDMFGEELYNRKRAVRRVEVAYCAESYCGDVLQFYEETAADGHHAVEIRKDNGEVVVRAMVFLA